ncbi:hypothetical protein AB4G91_02835 [Macrococcoides goetzii]|nr:hypothetical protein [Macrococcus sp. PK]MCH4984235.1 hypothetical protein [Macrococcus sp. PK]
MRNVNIVSEYELEEVKRDLDQMESDYNDLRDFIKLKGLEDEFMEFIGN